MLDVVLVSVLFLLFVWCPCMAINVSHELVQYDGGLLPDIIPCKVVFFGLATNALNVRNNNC